VLLLLLLLLLLGKLSTSRLQPGRPLTALAALKTTRAAASRPPRSGPAMLMVLEHHRAITLLRQMMGPTDPAKGFLANGQPASLRAKYGQDLTRNGLHGSADYEAAKREVGLFFRHLGEFVDDGEGVEEAHEPILDPDIVHLVEGAVQPGREEL
jgi:hypothetical protein